MTVYYSVIFVLSLLFSLIFICRWNHRYPAYATVLFVILPIVCYGYLVISKAENLSQALIGTKLTYLGGLFGTLVYVLSILTLCKFNMPKPARVVLFACSFIIYAFVITIRQNQLFYKSMDFIFQDGHGELIKTYGPVHTIFYIYVLALYVLSFLGVIQGMKKRYEVSKKTSIIFLLLLSISFIFFFLGRKLVDSIELIPITYLLGQLVLILMLDRVMLYDIDLTLVDVSLQRGDIAVISVDRKGNFLGCNDVAKNFFPVLKTLKIDDPMNSDDDFIKKISMWIGILKERGGECRDAYENGDKHFHVVVDFIKKGKKKIKGYNLMIVDDTEEYKYHKLIEEYNKTLEAEVKEKTAKISQINEVFGKNVSPQIRDYLLGGNVELGGTVHDITVMFCDIRDFTTISENMPSQKIVKMLNYYFTAMERCISAHNGVINKYMGDAIMALFGVPMPLKSHQHDAFAAALDMREMLKKLNKKFVLNGYPELHFGIGLHSGPVLAGNIGAENRMEYTVIGDTVNTASRMEGLCRSYNTDLLLSDDTAAAIMDTTSKTYLKFVDYADIRGRKEKVSLFTY